MTVTKKTAPKKVKKKKQVKRVGTTKKKKLYPKEISYSEKREKLKIGRKYAVENREKATTAELHMKQILEDLGYDFIFQHPIVPLTNLYILDFYLPQYKLCIEIDGNVHVGKEAQKKDRLRSKELFRGGIYMLRLWNNQVLKYSIEDINTIIQTRIKSTKSC